MKQTTGLTLDQEIPEEGNATLSILAYFIICLLNVLSLFISIMIHFSPKLGISAAQ